MYLLVLYFFFFSCLQTFLKELPTTHLIRITLSSCENEKKILNYFQLGSFNTFNITNENQNGQITKCEERIQFFFSISFEQYQQQNKRIPNST